MKKKVLVIGSGFSGLASAAHLAKAGFEVCVLEKNPTLGGRARVFEQDGFRFDMGPSWYWMPEVMEGFFQEFGQSQHDYFKLIQLDPAYQVVFAKDEVVEVTQNIDQLKSLFESKEPGAGKRLEAFLEEAQEKYEVAMKEFIQTPSLSIFEFAKVKMLRSALKLNLFRSFSKHVRKYFQTPELIQLLEFPILFLGARPVDIPALYSMMNYADMVLGTWYPMGGFGSLIEAMSKVAYQQGVHFHSNTEVQQFIIKQNKLLGVKTNQGDFYADIIVSSADYHFTEKILPVEYRNYSDSYWESRVMAPSCLIYYVGLSKKVAKLMHHNLFFENNFDQHAHNIYVEPKFPEDPLYYVCCPSKTDSTVAPEGMENLFILIPVAAGLEDTEEIRTEYFQTTVKRLEAFCGEDISSSIISYRDYAGSNFQADYHAFKGNAYGLANTLRQTAILKPKIINESFANLYYTGQLTVPGPGVPPAIISGKIVADLVQRTHL